jgi:uncharacterized membrane protein
VRRTMTSHLALMLLATTLVVLVGAVQKAPCANASWVERREGVSFQCYSDVADLFRTEQLAGGRLPFLDECRETPEPCDEYPVLSMYIMRGTASLATGSDPYAAFYWTNVLLLLCCALVTTWCIEKLGARTALFAIAPVLAVYGTMNWDLVPVALSTAALVALLDDRPVASGALLGLGAAVKVYPILLLVPFAAYARRQDGTDRAMKVIGGGAVAWLAINLPFVIVAPHGWLTFFRFNSDRPAEFDTVWRVLCMMHICPADGLVNFVSLGIPIVLTLWLWKIRVARAPETPLWSASFPLLVSFVLFNKVWSPQYALWLLPWFAIVAPGFGPYIAWQTAEVIVYIARFSYFDDLEHGSASYAWFGAAVAVRAIVLGWCLIAWARGGERERSRSAPPRSMETPSLA